MIIGHR